MREQNLRNCPDYFAVLPQQPSNNSLNLLALSLNCLFAASWLYWLLTECIEDVWICICRHMLGTYLERYCSKHETRFRLSPRSIYEGDDFLIIRKCQETIPRLTQTLRVKFDRGKMFEIRWSLCKHEVTSHRWLRVLVYWPWSNSWLHTLSEKFYVRSE